MSLYVIRHAHAGTRAAWSGDDRLRPLSERGHAESSGIADLLAGAGIVRIVSSPLLRCRQSVEPLAGRLGIEVEIDDRLAPETTSKDVLGLVKELRDTGAALCTHGEVMPLILEPLVDSGMTVDHPLEWPKGSHWRLDGLASERPTATYHPRVTADG